MTLGRTHHPVGRARPTMSCHLLADAVYEDVSICFVPGSCGPFLLRPHPRPQLRVWVHIRSIPVVVTTRRQSRRFAPSGPQKFLVSCSLRVVKSRFHGGDVGKWRWDGRDCEAEFTICNQSTQRHLACGARKAVEGTRKISLHLRHTRAIRNSQSQYIVCHMITRLELVGRSFLLQVHIHFVLQTATADDNGSTRSIFCHKYPGN